ncbi:MAG: thiamine phosphate synthase [Vicinamibacterales bacterium]|nr:thiamine phosphate synthase [Vicinamibacterales bacterium]
MPLPRARSLICLVTDRHRLAASRPSVDLAAFVGAAAAAGVDVIQIRERDLDAGALTHLVRGCLAAAHGTPARIVVNDRADVAIAAGAHGVHLRGDSVSTDRVRELLPPEAIVGRSVHSVEDAICAAGSGRADYLILGTMFPSASKPGLQRLTTMTGLTAASASISIPVVAIGGITVERLVEVARAGAGGVAAIGLFLPPAGMAVDEHLHVTVAELRRVFDTCGAVP